MKKVFPITLIACIVFITTGCTNEEITIPSISNENNHELIEQLAKSSLLNASTNEKRPSPTVWADCIQYSALVVPATFKPSSGNFDELYTMPEAMFANGNPLISDSKPG